MVDFWVVHSIRAESSTLQIKYAVDDNDFAEKYAEADNNIADKKSWNCGHLDQRIVGGMMVLPEKDSQSNWKWRLSTLRGNGT